MLRPLARQGIVSIAVVRLVSLIAFLVASMSLMAVSRTALFAMLALAMVFSVPYALWFRGLGLSERSAQVQFLIDLSVITFFVCLTGGMSSHLLLLYPLLMFSAAVVLPLRGAMEIAVACCAAYGLVALMTMKGLALASPAHMARSLPLISPTGHALLFSSLLTAGLVVARRCGYTDIRTAHVRQLADILLRNLPAGMMLVDGSNRIVLANRRACDLFRQPEEKLRGLLLTDLYAPQDGFTNAGDTVVAAAHYFRRSDGSIFPGHMDTACVSMISQTPLPGQKAIEFQVVTVNDISRLVDMQRQVHEAKRLRTAASMASQIAHEVRNPVAAISGSAQILARLERKDGDSGPNAPGGQIERSQLYDCIVEESSRLDGIIAKFLSFAEFSDERMQMLLRLADEVLPPGQREAAVAATEASVLAEKSIKSN